jgi:hypothetical protein
MADPENLFRGLRVSLIIAAVIALTTAAVSARLTSPRRT